ncbi:MAG: serine hydrolase [Defluviitaleaceae bacterium]|nr:serine hydrolase [Defluviitaleaceae bacterium]
MKRFLKKLTAVGLMAVMVVAGGVMAFAQTANLPLRQTLETAGAVVDWYDGQIFVSYGGGEWVFTPNAPTAQHNGTDVTLSTPVVIVDSLSFISADDIGLMLGDAGTEEISEPFAQTIELATVLGLQSTTEGGIMGMTIAVVDAETGFTWTQGFGYADSVQGHRVDEHTLFQIASTSKPFTAIAIMQLVEQGLIDLDTPFVYYVPEFSMLPSFIHGGNSDNITVRMLLSNTSGIMMDYSLAFYAVGDTHIQSGMNDILERLPVREMSFEEGTAYEYANLGWTLLSILVARVTGHDNYFEGFVQFTDENIFQSVGMNRSTFEMPNPLNNVAMGYNNDGQQGTFYHIGQLGAAGMFSSAHDMAVFMHDFLGGDSRLLTQGTINYMLQSHTDHVDMSGTGFNHYGLGFLGATMAIGISIAGHAGGIYHYFTDMLFDTDSQIGVFVSTNTHAGTFVATPVTAAILEMAVIEKTGMDIDAIIAEMQAEVSDTPALYDPEATPHPMSDEELVEFIEEFGGLYDFGPLGFWYVGLADGVITISSGDEVSHIKRMSDGTFGIIYGEAIPNSRYSFMMMEEQAISVFIASALGAVIPAQRIDDIEAWQAMIEEQIAPEYFSRFLGFYNFVPQVENEASPLAGQWIVALDGFGRATLAQITPFMPPVGQLLTRYEDRWFFMQTPIFFTYEDGVATLDLMGGQYVREQ